MIDTRGIRNCNPCNIRRSHDLWIGLREQQTDNKFLQFKSMVYGLRAVWKVLQTYYKHHDCDNILRIISRWAPAADNNYTELYIKHVAEYAHVEPEQHLGSPAEHRQTWYAIIRAMCIIESRYTPSDSELSEAFNLAFNS